MITPDVKQRILAFVCGDVVVTGWLKIVGILSGITQFGWQVFSVLVLGIAGGIAGVAGKDIYGFLKTEIIKRIKK